MAFRVAARSRRFSLTAEAAGADGAELVGALASCRLSEQWTLMHSTVNRFIFNDWLGTTEVVVRGQSSPREL